MCFAAFGYTGLKLPSWAVGLNATPCSAAHSDIQVRMPQETCNGNVVHRISAILSPAGTLDPWNAHSTLEDPFAKSIVYQLGYPQALALLTRVACDFEGVVLCCLTGVPRITS